ncbi:MAG: zinc-dependent metalloprotease, partial [Odoribacter sp.]
AKYLSRYLLQCGNVDVRIRENDEDKKIAGDILQYLISREVGFVLGLKPNFAGHRAFTVEQVRSVGWLKRNGYTASILDENTFNYVVQPEDGVKPEFLLPRLSVYDKWAIEWGYREFPGSQDEESDQKWLNRLFEKKAKKPFYDYVDFIENKGNAGSLELTSDRIEALELGIQNLKGLLQKMSKSENESACRQLMNKGCSQYLQYLSESCVGSVADQKKLLPFWNEYLCCGVPAWLEATDWWEYERQLPENRLLKTGEEIFHRLLSPEGGCDSLVNALQVILFNGFDCQYIPSAFQMNLQRRYLSVFLECVLNESVMASSDDYAGCMLVGLKTLYVKFKKLSSEHSDQLTASHYENLLRVCNKELEAKGARKLLLDL